jgi:D-cysteine desulfhydrase
MNLSHFPRRRYTSFATPIEFLPNLTRELAGPNIYIKRDDMLGLFPGGNKTRKLEFLVADALKHGADTLITCGAPQSNHCRITLAAAAKEGLKCRFVIEERVAGSYDDNANGNHFMFRLMGVEDLIVVPAGSDMMTAMTKVQSELSAVGRKGYIIPGGGSNAIGALGYVACVQEMMAQLFEQSLRIDHIIVGSGSSGTHAGVVTGLYAMNGNIPVTGIGVSRDPENQEPLVYREAVATCELLGIRGPHLTPLPRELVKTDGRFWRPKYSLPNKRMIEAVQMLARLEAIPLDPTYTGKIMAGLIGMVREGAFAKTDNVLFIHTGGMPSLFASPDAVLGKVAVADA